MRILCAQINPIIGDIAGNSKRIAEKCALARLNNSDVIVFPELSLCGYPPEDFLLLPLFLTDVEEALMKLLAETKGIYAIIGVPRKNPNSSEKPLLNSAAVIHDGKLIGYQDKTLLPTYDVFDERRYFEPNRRQPELWSIGNKKVAITICEDIWQHSDQLKSVNYQRDPIEEIKPLKPDLMINLSASPFSVGKAQLRLDAVVKASLTLSCPVLLCNQVGGNDSLIFDGESLFTDSKGALIGYAKKFDEDDLFINTDSTGSPLQLSDKPTQDLHDALVLGIRDYFRKQGFTKACLGLSGGIDSSVVACLAVEALGAQNVLGVLMPSRYTSQESLDDAMVLAKNLVIQTETLSIESPFQSYLNLLSDAFHGKKADVTEENLQARIRGMLLMALSNKHGYIVLSTGNKSETAMGYGTLYGDLCGGLAAINDVTKQQVYALARFFNEKIPGIIPQNIIEKAPSAELRPNQKDSDSLPEYPIVDNVLQDYIENHASAREIAEKHGYPIELVKELILKIHNSEYKRRQAPPGLRVSDKAFSIGRRFPIVQNYCK